MLEVPWELRQQATWAGAQWHPAPVEGWVWVGRKLPVRLTPFDSLPYSLERWKEDQLNGKPRPLPPAAGDLVPRPHQRDAINLITTAFRAGRLGFVLADDVGLGKTVSAVAAVRAITTSGMVLICCPLSVIPHWRATLLRMGTADLRVVVVNYDRLKRLLEPPPEALRAVRRHTKNKRTAEKGIPRIHPDIAVVDESHNCFPYDTPIATEHGPIPIGEIVDQQLRLRVWSRDDRTGTVRLRRVTAWLSQPLSGPLVRVVHEHGSVVCTADHPIWTRQHGYVSASSLAKGQGQGRPDMPLLQRHVHYEGERQDDGHLLLALLQEQRDLSRDESPHADRAATPFPPGRARLRPLWCRFCHYTQGASTGQEVLLAQLLIDGGRDEARPAGGDERPDAGALRAASEPRSGQEEPEAGSTDAAEQPHERSCGTGQDGGSQTRTHIYRPRRQWPADRSTASAAPTDRVADGVPDPDSSAAGPRARLREPASLLQGGPGVCGSADRDRGRWAQSQLPTLEVLGSTEDRDPRPSRVVGVEVLQRAGAERSGRSHCRNRRVFNLEVEHDHNYFAAGVLVHNCRHPDSQRSKAMARLTANTRFRLYLSATIGQDPLELVYLAPLFAQVTGEPVPTDKDEFVTWCQRQQVQIRKAEFGRLVWDENDRDVEWMRRLLFDPVSDGVPAGLRRLPTNIAGWPEVQHQPMPIALDVQARVQYATAWAEFRRQFGLATRRQQKATTPKATAKAKEDARVAKLRFRQKCSLLRVPGTAQLVADQLVAGRQVFVSLEFLDSVEALQAELTKRKIRCAVITGKVTGAAREAERLAFQRGKVKVVLSTVTEGISLHAGEDYQGQTLSTAPRVTALHDVRYSALKLTQIPGRCNRDGQAAPVLWLYGEGTAEEDVVMVGVPRMRRMKRMHGDDVAQFSRDMESVLEKAAQR